VLPGIVGAMQASEVVKLLVGAGDPLIGRYLLVDTLRMRFREIDLPKSPDCPICSPRPRLRGLVDEAVACADEAAAAPGREVSVEEVAAWLREGRPLTLLDVREPGEHRLARIEGALLVPLRTLPARLQELDRGRPVVALCHVGGRSMAAADFLRDQGFTATSMAGGIDAWSRLVDPGVPRY
jgi:adenylyltransferase/sulfurtransferase